MTHRLIIRPEADITDAAVWYQNQRSGLGDEFLAEVDAAIERVVANPHHYRFLYTRGAQTLNGFSPFPGMQDLNAVYESEATVLSSPQVNVSSEASA